MAIPKRISKEAAIEIQDKLVDKAPKSESKKARRKNLVSARFDIPQDVKYSLAEAALKQRRFQYEIVVEACEQWLIKNGFMEK